METISMPPITLLDLVNLTHQIVNLNVVYLAISITIILGSGVLFYFVSLKPIQEKIKKQSKDLKKEKDKNNIKFDLLKINFEKSKEASESKIMQLEKNITKVSDEKMNQLEKKMQEIQQTAKEEMEKIKFRTNETELKALWNEQYTWGIGSLQVEINELFSIVSYLDKTINYKQELVSTDLCLQAIIDVIEKIKKAEAVPGDKTFEKDIYNLLIKSLNKLDGNEEKKGKIFEEAKILLK